MPTLRIAGLPEIAMNEKPSAPMPGDINPGDDFAPGTPGTGQVPCPACHGSGRIEQTRCATCGGTGKVVRGVGGA